MNGKVARGMAELRKMEALETIHDKSAADFWRDVDAGKYKGKYEP